MTRPTQPDRDAAPTPPDRETVARVIDPSSWRVLDSYLERVKRHHPHGGYDPDNFTDKASLAKADAILALFATPSGYVLVPREATAEMLAEVGPEIGVPEPGDLAAAQVAALSHGPSRRDQVVQVLADIARDYRAMVQSALRGRGEGGAGEDQGASVDRVQAAPDGATGSGGVAGDGGLYPWLREPFRRHAHYIRAALSTYDGTAAADDVEAAWSAIVSVIPAEDWRSVSDPPEDGAWVFLYWPTMPIHFYPAVGFLDGGGWELTALREYGQVFPTHWCSMIAVPQPPRPAKTSAGQPSEASTAAPAPDAPISLPSPNDQGDPTPGPTTRGDG